MASEVNYVNYHRAVIEAEDLIFIQNKPKAGLNKFKETFNEFKFCFLDDCIEAFQIAIVYKYDDLSMYFVKRAIDNGLALKYLDQLYLGCGCNSYVEMRKRVTIHKEFIEKNKAELEKYAKSNELQYLRNIDTSNLIKIINRHVEEQLFKNCPIELCSSSKERDAGYFRVCNSNLDFIFNCAKNGIYLGERNLGNYSTEMLINLHLGNHTTELTLNRISHNFMLSKVPDSPVITNADYFGTNLIYNILFHSEDSYETLRPYIQEAIRKGFWHPREIISLKFNRIRFKIPENQNMYFEQYYKVIPDTRTINEMRFENVLPAYEIDFAKHKFAHENNLKLFFGFMNGTK